MLKDSDTFSSFSVDDVPAAKEFYEKTLGLDVTDDNGMLFLKVGGGGTVVVYPKGEAHVPASFTVLSFQVQDINATVDSRPKASHSSATTDSTRMSAGSPGMRADPSPGSRILLGTSLPS